MGRYLNVSRQNCYLVLTRNCGNPAVVGDRYAKWEPLSCDGWSIVCPSKKEATELMLMVGGAMYPWQGEAVLNDERYEAWLLDNHFRIVPHVPDISRHGTLIRALWFSEWVNRVRPSSNDLVQGHRTALPEWRNMVAAAMRS